jgi:hypothetical protein
MVIHSRRKSDRRPVQKIEELPVETSGYVIIVSEESSEPTSYTKVALTEEKINKKPRKKKKKA